MLYQLMTDLRMCSCESDGVGTEGSNDAGSGSGGKDVSGSGGIGPRIDSRGSGSVKSIVTTVPVERVIAAGGEVCIALLASKSATKPAL